MVVLNAGDLSSKHENTISRGSVKHFLRKYSDDASCKKKKKKKKRKRKIEKTMLAHRNWISPPRQPSLSPRKDIARNQRKLETSVEVRSEEASWGYFSTHLSPDLWSCRGTACKHRAREEVTAACERRRPSHPGASRRLDVTSRHRHS